MNVISLDPLGSTRNTLTLSKSSTLTFTWDLPSTNIPIFWGLYAGSDYDNNADGTMIGVDASLKSYTLPASFLKNTTVGGSDDCIGDKFAASGNSFPEFYNGLYVPTSGSAYSAESGAYVLEYASVFYACEQGKSTKPYPCSTTTTNIWGTSYCNHNQVNKGTIITITN